MKLFQDVFLVTKFPKELYHHFLDDYDVYLSDPYSSERDSVLTDNKSNSL